MTPDEARVGARVVWSDLNDSYTGYIANFRGGTADVRWDDECGGHTTWTPLADLRLLPDEAQHLADVKAGKYDPQVTP